MSFCEKAKQNNEKYIKCLRLKAYSKGVNVS